MAGGVPEPTRGDASSSRSWPSDWATFSSTRGPVSTDPTSVVAGGAGAPRTLLAPLQVELFSTCYATANPAFDSWIFLMVWRVFLHRAANSGSPEAPVISTSGSLPTEESEENSASSSAGWRSSAGAASSFPVSPSGRGAGD